MRLQSVGVLVSVVPVGGIRVQGLRLFCSVTQYHVCISDCWYQLAECEKAQQLRQQLLEISTAKSWPRQTAGPPSASVCAEVGQDRVSEGGMGQTCHSRLAGKRVLSRNRPRSNGHSVIPAPRTTRTQ